MVAYNRDPTFWSQRQEDHYKCKATLVSIPSSRSAGALEHIAVSRRTSPMDSDIFMLGPLLVVLLGRWRRDALPRGNGSLEVGFGSLKPHVLLFTLYAFGLHLKIHALSFLPLLTCLQLAAMLPTKMDTYLFGTLSQNNFFHPQISLVMEF